MDQIVQFAVHPVSYPEIILKRFQMEVAGIVFAYLQDDEIEKAGNRRLARQFFHRGDIGNFTAAQGSGEGIFNLSLREVVDEVADGHRLFAVVLFYGGVHG